MMTATVAMRMTPGREDFWIRIVIAFILFGFLLCGSLRENSAKQQAESGRSRVKYWKSSLTISVKPVGDKAAFSALDSNGRTFFVADAHRNDGKRFVVRADEKLTAFLELEVAIRAIK
jgi:hypothetical protein